MQELTREHPVQIRRSGYTGSGFSFYFVRCRDRKVLAEYVSRLTGGDTVFPDGEAPFGYSYSQWVDALPGVLPEACGSRLWTGYMIVVQGGIIDHGITITSSDERRHWNHEIGHTVEAFSEAYNEAIDAFIHSVISSDGDGWRMEESPSEAPAYCTEFLCENVDRLLSGSDAPANSGLPIVMPWCKEAK